MYFRLNIKTRSQEIKRYYDLESSISMKIAEITFKEYIEASGLLSEVSTCNNTGYSGLYPVSKVQNGVRGMRLMQESPLGTTFRNEESYIYINIY